MGIQLLCTLVIAKFLTPSEFGLVGMMSIFLAFSTVLIDSGFSQALIRDQEASDTDYSSVFYCNVLIAIAIYFIFFFLAPVIADFYAQPQLTLLLRVSFIAMIVLGLSVVQQAQLQKAVNYAKISKISLISVIISGIIGICVAIIYKNVWALIAQTLSFAILRNALFWILSSWRPKLVFSFDSIRKYFRFSLNILTTHIIASITDNLANLVIGKSFSPVELGNFTVPNKLQTSVAGTISFAIHRVSYSVMASFQNDTMLLRDYSQKIVSTAFFIIAPILVFLGVVSEDLFQILLSPEWTNAGLYFKYLCFIGAIYCFADINMDILIIRGKSNLVLKIEIVRKVLLVVSLLIGAYLGMERLLQLLVAYNIFNAVFVSYYSGKEIDCSLFYQFKQIRYALATIFFELIVSIITYLLLIGYNAYLRIAVIGIMCIICLLVCIRIFRLDFASYIMKKLTNKDT